MKKLLFVSFLILSFATSLLATNIRIDNINIVERNNADKYIIVQFDLAWDYSFRVDDGANANWDAAWVFMKYKNVTQNNVQWGHATLANGDHHIPGNFTSDLGAAGGANKGIFVYPSVIFANNAQINGMRLRWDYGEDGLEPEDEVDIRVFGIEMVYVPQGSFYVGSGGDENDRFHAGGEVNTPFQVGSASFEINNTTGNLWATGSRTAGSFSAGYPNGYNAFYMMKHNITQQAYVDFLNTLTVEQQAALIEGNPWDAAETYANNANRHKIKIATSGSAGSQPAVYETDYPYVPKNYFSPNDLLTYLDWAALRPFTELEYEKAARGPASPVPNEYAWGNTRIGKVTSISDVGLATEAPVPTGYQRDITIDHTKVNEDFTDYPVLVRLDDGFNFNNCRQDGWDIRFYDSGGNLLSYQRERHDFDAKKAEYWVKVPAISSTQNTVITMEYGNASATDGADAGNVWNPGITSLWHLNESDDTFSDSQGTNTGTEIGLLNVIEGKTGPAQSFDGTSYLEIPHAVSLDIENEITISGWVKPQQLSGISLAESTTADWNDNFLINNIETSEDKLALTPGAQMGHRIVGPIDLSAIKHAGNTLMDWEDEFGYTIIEYTQDGTFKVPPGVTEVDVLVVAGGGGGGRSATPNASGGGGAGALIWEEGHLVSPGTTVNVKVGAGGTGGNGSAVAASAGEDSSFGTISAQGGGRGGQNDTGLYDGGEGGSGGGAASTGFIGGIGTLGYAGGNGQSNAGGGAGGGGAASAGGNAAGNDGANGGAGLDLNTYFGTNFGHNGWFAGGGGGGSADDIATPGTGGNGGGGDAARLATDIPHAMPNTGGGGGAGNAEAANSYGGNGGSGVVLIRFKDPRSARIYASISDSNVSGYPGMQIFTEDGTFSVPEGVEEVEVLVVAGGGAGGDHTSQGTQTGAGGGGGGGVVYNATYSVTPGGIIHVSVGMGGNTITDNRGEKGGNSIFGTLIADGGGGGGYRASGNGIAGGSGGGAGYQGSGGTGTADQGFDGGAPYNINPNHNGGGGGGAAIAGGNATINNAGRGGDGLPIYISGLLQYYGAGGGGGAGESAPEDTYGYGGAGGGGRGGLTGIINATDALPNTGSGGGGAGSVGSEGGSGGSGIVIVRWGTEAVKGNPIPGINPGDDLSGKYLWIRQELTSNNDFSSPQISAFNMEIQGEAIIAGKGTDAYQLSYSNGRIKGYINNTTITSSNELILDEYQHVALSYNGTALRLFVNGILRATQNISGTINTNAENMKIGMNMQGEIDEVRIFNVAATQAWLNAEYHSGIGDLVQIGGEAQNVNAVFGNENHGDGAGPLRVGFGATPTSSRTAAGASYWGILELSGNLWERVVPAGSISGRTFTGLHGDGVIDASGIFTVANWSLELGNRGGSYHNPTSVYFRISDRSSINWNAVWANRHHWQGGRGVRTAP